MTEHRIWDPLVRIFHWSLVLLFAANALFTDDESKTHEVVGYAIAALIAVRVLWGLVGPYAARFASFAPTRAGLVRQMADIAAGRRKAHMGHSPLGALMIFNLLLSIAGIALTGHLMTTDTFWGVDWVEEAHEALVTWAEISVVLHVGAVIWESRRTGVNLPRAMVTGVKRIPKGVSVDP
ncbi:cytochrome b/b6 domain-containing protein [Tropicibacter oceani]|uniref:Cytochrome b/b6 domain-containing protein n=1 Tax=Tropicibacter oceani TaxID=3058420 RepID=A0ABY8QER4_9RHOB|nr:cytochrome b/b6 domain-containing protein [Tropicibacter oceani]WGW03010.1 cytochrome b/b6 domain-containing protein [Tropicibacter oceani]